MTKIFLIKYRFIEKLSPNIISNSMLLSKSIESTDMKSAIKELKTSLITEIKIEEVYEMLYKNESKVLLMDDIK